MKPAYNQSDWLLLATLRRCHIEVDHEGRLKVVFDESVDVAAKRIRDHVIKETDE